MVKPLDSRDSQDTYIGLLVEYIQLVTKNVNCTFPRLRGM